MSCQFFLLLSVGNPSSGTSACSSKVRALSSAQRGSDQSNIRNSWRGTPRDGGSLFGRLGWCPPSSSHGARPRCQRLELSPCQCLEEEGNEASQYQAPLSLTTTQWSTPGTGPILRPVLARALGVRKTPGQKGHRAFSELSSSAKSMTCNSAGESFPRWVCP